MQYSLGSIYVLEFSHHRNLRKSQSSWLWWERWNIFSMKQIIAIWLLWNLQSTPVSAFIKSGPVSRWSLREAPSNHAEQSNTTLILMGFLGWYTPWCGMYQVLLSFGVSSTSSASPFSSTPAMNFKQFSLYLGLFSIFRFKCFNRTIASCLLFRSWGHSLKGSGISRCPSLLCWIFPIRSCRNWMSCWDMFFSLGLVSNKSASSVLITDTGVIAGSPL